MKKIFRFLGTMLMIVSMLIEPLSVYAATDYRDAGVFSGDKSIYVGQNGMKYYSENIHGATTFIPYNQNMTGDAIFKNMFIGLFNIYKSAVGSHYDSAGARYNAPTGFTNIAGINTSYYTKSLAVDEYGNATHGAVDLKGFEPNYNIEFRYAGIFIDKKHTPIRGTVVSNPNYPSDFSSSSGNGATFTYHRYKKDGTVFNTQVMHGAANGTHVIPQNQLQKNYAGGSGIPSNITSTSPYIGQAKETFEKWAEITQIGYLYKQTYSGAYGDNWWNYLKDYIRIDGDYNTQTVYLTAVYNDGSLKYKTYSIPYPVEKNMIAARINILDDKNNLLDYSVRETGSSAIEGSDYIKKNQGVSSTKTAGQAVVLERDKQYQVEVLLEYTSMNNQSSTTDKNSSAASPVVEVYSIVNRQPENGAVKQYSTNVTSSMSSLTSEEREILNTSTTGKYTTKKTMSLTLGSMGDEVSVGMGGAAYQYQAVGVDMAYPEYGTLRVAVPEIYDQNGDNNYKGDDYIEIDYTLTGDATPIEPLPDDGASYGDMNLGQREYRRLHYKKTIMEEGDDEDGDGEPEEEPHDYEYVTDYGTWESYSSAPDGEEAGDWDGVPEATGDIYPISDDAWWEYDQEWPDQSEDLNYKIWLTRNGSSWDENDEEYYRSETSDYPFSLGFSTARSRASDETAITPHLNVSIYGISPETDDDGELIESFKLVGRPINPYTYSEQNYIYLTNQYIAQRYATAKSANDDYPFIRVTTEIDKDYHGESGIYGDSTVSPYHNGWQSEHDTAEKIFEAVSDDMELTDVVIKDSEGIIIYHATQEGGTWKTPVNGYFDKEEDLTMDVTLKQTVSAGHNVKNPTIDVVINGEARTGGNVSTYVNRAITNEETMGLDVETHFNNIAFRPKDVTGINFNIKIDDIHGANNWRENIWHSNTDQYYGRILCTTANMKLSQEIETYNSKHNKQDYLTFAEKLNFKFDIQHIGTGERQMAIIGNSKINPLAKLDVAIYDADMLTQDANGNIKFDNVRVDDDKAAAALIWTGTAQAQSRLFPGLGQQNYSTHVQAWINNYAVQSHRTPSGNQAAYGRILVTAGISNEMYRHGLNENTDEKEDYVQQEMIGEHNLYIADMVVTGQNSISDNSWYYSESNQDDDGELIQENPNGITVSVAVGNMASAHTDPTVVDRVWLDIYVGDNLEVARKNVVLDVPNGEVVPVSVVIPNVLIEKNLKVTARVNYGKHQTHFEYVLPSTNTSLNIDPFTDNVAVRTVSPNLPDTETAPKADIQKGLPDAVPDEDVE